MVGMKPGEELLDRRVVELALEGSPQHPQVEPLRFAMAPHPAQKAAGQGPVTLAEEPRAELRRPPVSEE